MKITDRRVSAWREAHPQDKDSEWDLFANTPRTILVHKRDADTVDTGLLNSDGSPIHRRVRRPIGFVVFD